MPRSLVLVVALVCGCSRSPEIRREIPRVPPPTNTVQEIAIGAGQACLRMADASVYCWGSDHFGSVGVPGPSLLERYHTVPVRVPDVAAQGLFLVGLRTCAVQASGRLACWGTPSWQRDPDLELFLPRGRLVSSLDAGCVISSAGAALCWGADRNARLSPGDQRALAGTFSRELPPHVLQIGAPVTSLVLGDRHGCALLRDRRVSCWGLNNFSQLGDWQAGWDGRAEPAIVAGLDDVAELAAGSFHTCARKTDGSVWCWGRGDRGELGVGTTVLDGEGDRRQLVKPTRVAALPPIEHIAAQLSETCALARGGELWCWGDNEHGQIGDGTSDNRFTPVAIRSIDHVVQIALRGDVACALTASGEVYCWGDNEDGVLGNGRVEASALPVKVTLPGAPAVAAAPGKPVTYESLACGFRITAPGKRVRAVPADEVVDAIEIEPLGATQIAARCTRHGGPNDALGGDALGGDALDGDADSYIDALEHRAIAERQPADPPPQRRHIGGATCLATSGRERTMTCLRGGYVIAVSVRSPDRKLAETVINSVELFDPAVSFGAAVQASAAPPPPGMIAIAGGEFAMGCTNQSLLSSRSGQLGCSQVSQPLHRVRLSRFAIDRTEVTVRDYAACVAAGACTRTVPDALQDAADAANHPVCHVTWTQATAYCAWKHKRLPTEAEWERAARGVDLRQYPWDDEFARCQAARSHARGVGPSDVGQLPECASPDGVLDMVGSVKEWVADRFAKTYYLASPLVDPRGPASGVERVIRGSSAIVAMAFVGPAAIFHRYGSAPSFQSDEIGFRCAASAGKP